MEGSERERLRTLLKEQSLMLGDFTLASGKKSNFYFDSKRTTLLPEGAWLAAREILRVIRERGIEADAIWRADPGGRPDRLSRRRTEPPRGAASSAAT